MKLIDEQDFLYIGVVWKPLNRATIIGKNTKI